MFALDFLFSFIKRKEGKIKWGANMSTYLICIIATQHGKGEHQIEYSHNLGYMGYIYMCIIMAINSSSDEGRNVSIDGWLKGHGRPSVRSDEG